jgi:hypothetical protein
LIEYLDAGSIGIWNTFQAWKAEVIWVFVGDPDVIDGGERRWVSWANQSPAIVEDLPYKPGITQYCLIVAFNCKASVPYETDLHDSASNNAKNEMGIL